MKLINSFAITAVCVAGFATSANATTFPTFVIDESESSIVLTQGSLGNATLTADFSDGVDGYTWESTGANDSVVIDNFIDWDVSGLGLGAFDVEVTLAFSSPDVATSGSISGGGFFGSFFGFINAGILTWNGFTSVAFDQGSVLLLGLEGGVAIGTGGVSTSAVLYGNDIVPLAPIPLPASGLLLLSALGGFGVISRRRRKTAA